MPYIDLVKTDAIDLAGSTILYNRDNLFTSYLLTGSGTLTGSTTVSENPNDSGGNPLVPSTVVGLTYRIRYEAQITYSSSFTITIFGRVLTAVEALNNLNIVATYNGSSWDVQVVYVKTPVTKAIALTTGGTVDLNFVNITKYLVTGTQTLSSNFNVRIDPALSNPAAPMTVEVVYQANATLNGSSVVILGKTLTVQQAAGNVIVRATFDVGSSSWIATVLEGNNKQRSNGSGKIFTYTSGTVTTLLSPNIDQQLQIIKGSGTLTGNLSYGAAAVTINEGEGFDIWYQGQFVPNGHSVTIFSYVLSDNEVSQGNIFFQVRYVNATWQVKKVSTSLYLKETIVVPVSFETGEQGKVSFPVNYDYEVLSADFSVSKDVAATDNGSIDFDIGGTPLTPASQSVASGATVGTTYHLDFTATNLGSAGSILGITSGKTTPGGRVLVILTLQRTT